MDKLRKNLFAKTELMIFRILIFLLLIGILYLVFNSYYIHRKSVLSTYRQEINSGNNGISKNIVSDSIIKLNKDQIYNFKNEAKEFNVYIKSFFSIWNNQIDKDKDLIELFNNLETRDEDKKMLSVKLYEEYDNFFYELYKLKVPNIAEEMHDYALKTISARRLFFLNYSKNNINNLKENKYDALVFEDKFWAEFNDIFDKFEADAEKMGLSKENKNLIIYQN